MQKHLLFTRNKNWSQELQQLLSVKKFDKVYKRTNIYNFIFHIFVITF